MRAFINGVPRDRFERSTHSLEGCCSIQLSYRGKIVALLIGEFTQFMKNISHDELENEATDNQFFHFLALAFSAVLIQ